jgi:hypothetical protein
VTDELLIQPKLGHLTRISDVVDGHIYTVCDCGRFGRLRTTLWRNGMTRPQSCKPCQVAGRKRFSLTKRQMYPHWK